MSRYSWEADAATYVINKKFDKVAKREGINLNNPRRKGARAACSTTGAVVGGLLGGPLGAVLGGVFGNLLATEARYPDDD